MIYFEPVCFKCKHYDKETATCAAFPKEIPDIIYYNGDKHEKPIKGQKNDIVFEPLK
jgi:hypothetical protein